jgi:hypothetical protein
MGFETIENVRPAAAPATPANGVQVSWRGMKGKRGFITIGIGPQLDHALGLRKESEPIRLLLGKDGDAGKIAVSHDTGGRFVAKGKPGKTYRIAINVASAKGLFATEFPSFAVDRLEVLRPAGNGVVKQFVFRATEAFLAAGD